MTSARDTPEAAATSAADSPTPLPLAWHLQTEYEVAVAYDAGYRLALADVAAGHAELGEAWKPIGRREYAARVRERLEQMEQAAATGHARHGTTEWVGLDNGAVLPSADWPNQTATSAASRAHLGRAA